MRRPQPLPLLARRENLLRKHVHALAAPHRLQAVKVLLRVGEAVGVVHAEACHDAAHEPLEREGVGVVKHVLVLHAQRDQFVDVEEAPKRALACIDTQRHKTREEMCTPVVNLTGSAAPIGEAIGLFVQEGERVLGA